MTESVIDELPAGAAAYRRALLDRNPPPKAVLDLAAERAGWATPLPAQDAD